MNESKDELKKLVTENIAKANLALKDYDKANEEAKISAYKVVDAFNTVKSILTILQLKGILKEDDELLKIIEDFENLQKEGCMRIGQ